MATKSADTGRKLDPSDQDEPSGHRGRSPTEREVLRVLWASSDQYLVRSEIHRRMSGPYQPTLGRIGQILAALFEERLLRRVRRPSQGSRLAAFYTLSDHGLELCRQMGFEREESALFPMTEELRLTYLSQDRLAARPKEPGRLVAFFGTRGGLGRTTMVAHTARGLASTPDNRQILAVDLDFEQPGLDCFFAPQGISECRGLRGLVVDFLRQPSWNRTRWLRTALSRVEHGYVLQPLPDVPSLYYLPSGLGPGYKGLSTSERAEALTFIREEAGFMCLTGRSEPVSIECHGFLGELRKALLDTYDKIFLDPQPGQSLGTWIVTQVLADEIVVCAQFNDTSPMTLECLQSVLANFLRCRELAGERESAIFAFALSSPELPGKRLDEWVDCHISNSENRAASEKESKYRTVRLDYNVRLVNNPGRWEPTRMYNPLVTCLEDPGKGHSAIPTPEAQALLEVLDAGAPHYRRSIAAGVLANSPFEELARLIAWYSNERTLHRNVDTTGDKLIRNALEAQTRRLAAMILRSEPE